MRSARKRQGFTLVEALVAVAILGGGIALVMGGFAAVARAEFRAREVEQMHRLAVDKYEELRAITDTFVDEESGDFSDRGFPDYTWSSAVEPTGITDLDSVTVTVQRTGGDSSSPTAEISGLVFDAPEPVATGAAP